jgi:hypothetical protein
MRYASKELTMPSVKQASKRRVAKKSVPVLGAAGLSLFAGGASATTGGPAADVTATPNIMPNQQVMLGEEELSDVSLATFYVFDKETTKLPAGTVQMARMGCGGCHGCGGCRGCRGCGRGCFGCRGCGCGGCGGCWCFPWPWCSY